MTARKYTPDERKKIQIEQGKRLAAYWKTHRWSPEKIEAMRAAGKEFQKNMPLHERKRISEIQSASTKLQMQSPEARSHISKCRKKFWAYRNYKPVYEMTQEIRDKISAAQIGKKKEWLCDPERLLAFRKKNAKRWFLISPRGQRFEFVGLKLFIENNPSLFTPHQLELSGKQNLPRAMYTMQFLSPTRSRVAKQALGWIWDYEAEMKVFSSCQNYCRN